MASEKWPTREKRIDISLLVMHVCIIIYALITEIFDLDRTVFSVTVFMVFVNVVWTLATILFIYKLMGKVGSNLDRKETELTKQKADFDLAEKKHLSLLEQLKRKGNYADALKPVNQAFGELHQVMRDISADGGPDKYLNMDLSKLDEDSLRNLSDELEKHIVNIIDALRRLCNHTEAAFRMLTQVDSVAVCIKIISGDLEGNLESCHAETIVRGSATEYIRGLSPQYKLDGTRLIHKLSRTENTSFSSIIDSINNKAPRPFFCNALPLLPVYENSSFFNAEYGGKKPDKRPGMNWSEEEILSDWKLPYKATIVLPLLPDHIKGRGQLNMLLGFLCIDTEEINTFNFKYDTELLSGFTDGCYNKINILKKFTHRYNEIRTLLNNQ